jgi:hypothetical protein
MINRFCLGYSLANTKCGITLSIKVRRSGARVADALDFLVDLNPPVWARYRIVNTDCGILLALVFLSVSRARSSSMAEGDNEEKINLYFLHHKGVYSSFCIQTLLPEQNFSLTEIGPE